MTPLKFWLITIGEPLPTDGQGDRLLRTGILAERLVQLGHQVTWWTSGFDHVRKRHRREQPAATQLAPNYSIRLLSSCGYRSNVSLFRIADHIGLARQFRRQLERVERPDVILCSWPTIELCYEAVRYGRETGTPVVLDVRDMWPQAIVDLAPKPCRPLAKWLLHPMYRQAKFACEQATAITGITEECIDDIRGLGHAPRSRFDRAFPMAYGTRQPKDEDIRAAKEFWRQHGVVEDGVFTACFFGTFGRQFEVPTVITAASELARRGIPARFVLCGAGPEIDAMRRLAADQPSVILPGWVNSAQIWTLMRLSSAGLAPYLSSRDFRLSIPNKPIEYVSAGLPVISSLQGVLANLLHDWNAGMTYQNGAAHELADLIAKLQAEPAWRRELANNASRLFREKFVAERVYQQMAEYLASFAETRTPAESRAA